jgi:CTP-dependent riboflavin kinase
MFAGMRSLDLARDDNTSGMRSLDLARDDNTFGFAGMTHSNNQSGSRSVVVIPRRTCEESHPRQSMPMFAGMRSLELARDDNTFGFVGMTHSNNQSGSRSVVVIPSRTCEESHPRQSLPMCAGMRSLDLARDDDTSGMRSLDLARDENTFGFAGMTHSNNQSGSRSIVVIPRRTCEESHPRQSLPMCAGMRSLGVARMPV